MSFQAAVEVLLLAAWAGAAWFAGLVVAPQLFHLLPAVEAGNIAGLMFRSVFWLSLPALSWTLVRSRGAGRRLDAWLPVTALVFSLVMELALHPWIAAMRDGATPRDPWFGVAHGASSILFLVNCVLAATILLRRVSAVRR